MIYVLYHSHCPDGFGAAFAAWKKLGKTAKYLPVSYGDPVPNITKENSEIYIVDFSFPKPILEELASKFKVTLIDHHKTAEKDLEGLPFAHFDMTHSGAVLTYKHFFPGEEVPDFFRYLEDRDLWKFEMEHSKEFQAYLGSHPFKFQVWEEILNTPKEKWLAEGTAILRRDGAIVDSMTNKAALIEFEGHKIAVVNVSYFWSEAGHHLLEERFKEKGIDYALLYTDVPKDRKRIYSLRSLGDFDVSVIAKKFGGGGHKNASGFQFTLNKDPVYPQLMDLIAGVFSDVA